MVWCTIYVSDLLDVWMFSTIARLYRNKDVRKTWYCADYNDQLWPPLHIYVSNRIPRDRLFLAYETRRARKNPNYTNILRCTYLLSKITDRCKELHIDVKDGIQSIPHPEQRRYAEELFSHPSTHYNMIIVNYLLKDILHSDLIVRYNQIMLLPKDWDRMRQTWPEYLNNTFDFTPYPIRLFKLLLRTCNPSQLQMMPSCAKEDDRWSLFKIRSVLRNFIEKYTTTEIRPDGYRRVKHKPMVHNS